MKCEKCQKPDPDIRYNWDGPELSTSCCHADMVNDDGSEFSEDQIEALLEAETERIRKDVMYDE